MAGSPLLVGDPKAPRPRGVLYATEAVRSSALASLLSEIAELERLAPERVTSEVHALVESLRARRKTCHGCATETIGERRPKHGQRTFCSAECSACAAQEDFRDRRRAARRTL